MACPGALMTWPVSWTWPGSCYSLGMRTECCRRWQTKGLVVTGPAVAWCCSLQWHGLQAELIASYNPLSAV